MNTQVEINELVLENGTHHGPTSRSYWVLRDRLAVGAYPGKKDRGSKRAEPEVIAQLLDSGIDVFINLTEDYPGGTDEHLVRYDCSLGTDIVIERFPIGDVSIPTVQLMEEILDSIDGHLGDGRTVYVHCWGGIGRAGTTISCWLLRHGYVTPDNVFDALDQLRQGDTGAGHRQSPETIEQAEFVLDWPRVNELTERVIGCLLGGAVGDALGAGVEFSSLDEIVETHGPNGVTEMTAAYGKRGAITDDTQMTLFTAEGFIRAARQDLDKTAAVWDAYRRWYCTQGGPQPEEELFEHGLLTIADLHHSRAPGLTSLGALAENVPGCRTAPLNNSRGCGGVMRAAPAGLVANSAADAYELGCDIAALTHGHPTGWVAAGTFAAMIYQLTQGVPPREAVNTAADMAYQEKVDNRVSESLAMALLIAEHAEVSPKDVEKVGAGWTAEEALAIATLCFLTDKSPREKFLMAVNHSGDSDSTGAILGNLIGATHGRRALPSEWTQQVELSEVIVPLAMQLASI